MSEDLEGNCCLTAIDLLYIIKNRSLIVMIMEVFK